MNIGQRLQVSGPDRGRDIPPWTIWRGHGSDEYGNCSVHFKIACLGGFVLFWEPPEHFQHDIELPGPGVSPWIDRRYYGDTS